MTGPPYDWTRSLRDGDMGGRVLDACFARMGYTVERANPTNARHDRYLVKRGADLLHLVDYKTDYKAGTTGNLAIEDVSVIQDGVIRADGWLRTTTASDVVYYVPRHDVAYWLNIDRLRDAWPEIISTFRTLHTETVDVGRGWRTVFYAPSIAWLDAHRLIVRRFDAVGFQGRFNFPAA